MTDPTTPGAVTAIATTLGPLFRVLPQILERIVKPGATELGLFVGQEISAIRRRRLIALDTALEKELAGRTPAAEPMDPVYLLDVLEGACRAGDDDVTALWAKLLAANVETPESPHPLFVRALESLSGSDAEAFAAWCTGQPRRAAVESTRRAQDARLHAAGLLTFEFRDLVRRPKGFAQHQRYTLSGVGVQLGTVLGLIEF